MVDALRLIAQPRAGAGVYARGHAGVCVNVFVAWAGDGLINQKWAAIVRLLGCGLRYGARRRARDSRPTGDSRDHVALRAVDAVGSH